MIIYIYNQYANVFLGLLIQHALRLLQQLSLVGAAAALGDVKDVVRVAMLAQHVDLRGQIRPGVRLLEHRQRRHLSAEEGSKREL